MICHIVGAGEMGGARIRWREGDFLIAADGGYAEVRAQGLKPDLVVGDFDSLGYAPEAENVVRHPVQKDDTDMLLAVKLGFERGCDTFCLYGALGGRLDHTIANLQTIQYIAQRGARAYIVGDICVAAVQNGELRFRAEAEGTISVFSLNGEARGVTLEGLFYPLSDASLAPTFPLGVSNEFTGKPARAAVGEGTLVVIFPSMDDLEAL